MATPSPAASPPLITSDDHSPLVSIALYFLMTTFVLAVLIRFAIRYSLAKTVGHDDWICFGAMILAIGQVISVAIGINHGLGKQSKILNSDKERAVSQAEYSGDIFYLLALGVAKVSILLMLRRICTVKKHRIAIIVVCGLVGAWTVAGVIALAARCGTALPWTVKDAQAQCINQHTFWIGMLPADILTEVLLIVIASLMMKPVQIALSKKVVIVGAFLARLALVAASITRIFYVVDYVPSDNFTFTTINTEILNQVVLCVSITTACIPCLKPFLDVFDSGQMNVRVRDKTSQSGSNSYHLGSMAYARDTSGRPRNHRMNTDHDPPIRPIVERRQSASIESDSRSDKMIINKTVEYQITYESAEPEQSTARGWR